MANVDQALVCLVRSFHQLFGEYHLPDDVNDDDDDNDDATKPPKEEQLVLEWQQQIGKWGRGLILFNPWTTTLLPIPPLAGLAGTHVSDVSRSFNVEDKEFVMDCGHEKWVAVWRIGGKGLQKRKGSEGYRGKAGEGAGGGGELSFSSPLTHCCT